MKRYQIVLLGLAFTMFFACKPHRNKFGLEFNPKRSQFGLPLLNNSWKIVNDVGNLIQWMPANKEERLVYNSKLIIVKNDRITREENHYLGRRMYQNEDGSHRESVYISCDFDEIGNVSQWTCNYHGNGFEYGKDISKVQADSIVHNWGLN